MMPAPKDPDHEERRTRRTDTILAVTAALAMVAFAWAGFQSAEWVRARFLRSDEAATLGESALELSAGADRLEERDTLLYVEWRLALESADDETADVIFGLIRPPLQKYLREAPVDDAGLPLAPPFDDPNYDVVIKRDAAADLDTEARQQKLQSREASRNGALYGGPGVMFAAALAAVGIASRFNDIWIRRGLTVIAVALLVSGLGVMVLSPLSLTAP
jgi:hypothetical protein